MNQDIKNVKTIAITLAALTFMIIVIDWLFIVDIFKAHNLGLFEKVGYKILLKLHKQLFLIRVLFLISSGLSFYATKKVENKKEYSNMFYIIGGVAAFLFCNGYQNYYLYNLICYPVLLLMALYFMYIIISFSREHLKEDEIFGLSQKKKKEGGFQYKYKILTKDNQYEYLYIHSPEQHMYIQGGSGAGKGGSIIHTTLYQNVQMDLPGVVYSYKGFNSKLVKTLYLGYYHRIKNNNAPSPELKLFNFTDLTRSYRSNPIDAKYIKSPQHADAMAMVIAKSLNKEWIKKLDEWGKWAVAIIKSLIWKLVSDHPNLSNIPFLVEILHFHNVEAIINFIESNEEARMYFRSASLAKEGSKKQFTGILTTALSGFSGLISKEMYWLLSADEINFDVTNPINPQILILCNDEELESVANPILSAMFSLVMKKTNQPGKLPGFLSLDEIYTLYIDGLAKYANTVRENKVFIQIGNQEDSMLTDMWGVEKAYNVRGACGNQVYGMAGTEKSAEIPVKMLSNKDVVNFSYGETTDSHSVNESLKEKKVVQIRDIMSFPLGYFLGKVANGKPPYFKGQFAKFEYEDDLDNFEIPPFVLDQYTPKELQDAIEDNYYDIKEKTATLLTPFIPVEEEKTPKKKKTNNDEKRQRIFNSN